jgi:hypothetical protein
MGSPSFHVIFRRQTEPVALYIHSIGDGARDNAAEKCYYRAIADCTLRCHFGVLGDSTVRLT